MGKEKASGRGKKTCPSCGEIVGARTRVCPKCQFVFEIKTGASATRQGTGLVEFLDILKVVKEWGERYKTWEEAREVIAGAFDLAEKVGGEEALMALLNHLENEEA